MIGIVAEFNPFHDGHAFLIESAKEALGEQAVLAVMSGDFVQRGEAAIADKFSRAVAAVKRGCDLVVELPVYWSLSSSERFAMGAVHILNNMGCDYLAFGSECGNKDRLIEAADILSRCFGDIKIYMKRKPEMTFPAAMRAVTGLDILDGANNLLGVDYIRALKSFESDMKPFTVMRTNTHDGKGSAKAIRETMSGPDLEKAILSRLKMFDREYYSNIPDSANGAGNRLYESVKKYSRLEDIYSNAKTKSFTMSRVRRMAMCACIGIKEGDNKNLPPYIRVLSFNDRGRDILSSLRKKTEIPIITQPKQIYRYDKYLHKVFDSGVSANELYKLGFDSEENFSALNDWQKGPIIV